MNASKSDFIIHHRTLTCHCFIHIYTHRFQADVGRVMDIIINSLYSNRDVFLRELVSNAADACDKKRFLSITGDDSDGTNLAKPTIRIRSNKENMTVTIEDSGVGMTKSELQNNLGKIAQSGTKKFLEALGENGGGDVNLIGQFGVGFYSAYLVADKVEVVTRSMQPNSVQLRWTSDASSKYTIAEDDDSDDPIEGSGTRLILHLKDDALEYLEPSKLEDLLQHYSEFVEFPISVWKEKTEYKRVPDEEANEDLPEGEEPKMKTVPETTEGYEQMNTNKPIWLRSPSDVTEEEYKDFYQSAFRASYDEPLAHTHFSLEGQIECKSILYIPGMLPFELSRDMFDDDSRNNSLYVKREAGLHQRQVRGHCPSAVQACSVSCRHAGFATQCLLTDTTKVQGIKHHGQTTNVSCERAGI